MEIVVLNHKEIEGLLPMYECIDVMSEVLSALARGEAHNPLRSVVRPADTDHFLGLLPAYRGGANPRLRPEGILYLSR